MIVHAYLGEIVHHMSTDKRRRFRPSGPIMLCEPGGKMRKASERPKENPRQMFGGGGLSARLFVGLNVGDTPTHSIEDVVKVVGDNYKGSASFIAQKGIYIDDHNHAIHEDSVQVLLFADTDSEEKFLDEMTKLGETLASKLQQESVVLELQKKGISQGVYGVRP
jgi:hypothetical protein